TETLNRMAPAVRKHPGAWPRGTSLMTHRNLAPQIEETLAGARGAAASLGQVAVLLAEAASEPGPDAPLVHLKHSAATLQVQAQRAALGAMAAGAAAARLETWAHALALRETSARQEIESEARADASLFPND